MHLFELHNSRQDLEWQNEGAGTFTTTFTAGDMNYGITVQTEVVEDRVFGRVDFHVKGVDGKLRHDMVNIGPKAFEVLGVVVNGVRERFGDLDGYLFVAKRALYPDEYDRRIKIYGRMAHKLHIENNMHISSVSRPSEHAFMLTHKAAAMDILRQLLGDELKDYQ